MAVRPVRSPSLTAALLLVVAACGSSSESTGTGVEQPADRSSYEVTFEVEGNATVDIWWGATTGPGDIMTTDDMNMAPAAALPWTADETVSSRSIAQLVALPQQYREGDAVLFTCRILIDGRIDSEATAQDQWGCTVSSVAP